MSTTGTAGLGSPFVHLHVASGYSLQHGASSPQQLVDQAVALAMDALALTDRDGLYGAVKFVLACQRSGLAPILGVDLATAPSGLVDSLPAWADPHAAARAAAGARGPVRGGAQVDPGRARITVLAQGSAAAGGAGRGWAALCRLVSAAHLASSPLGGGRGMPVVDAAAVARQLSDSAHSSSLVVLLGPSSELGRAVLARRPDLARAVLAHWRAVLPPQSLAIEVVCHHGPPTGPLSVQHAARMLALARDLDVPAVLTNAVRYATPDGAATADVLDAARRLVALDARHLDRVTARGHLASTEDMQRTAAAVAGAVGGGSHLAHEQARRLLDDTAALAGRCRLDPRADLGIGSLHLPEPAALGLGPGEGPQGVLRARAEAAVVDRYPHAGDRQLTTVRERLQQELDVVEHLGYARYFLTVAAVCDLLRGMGVRVAARGSGAGSLVNYLLGVSGVEPIEHGLLMQRFCSPLRAQLPDIDLDVESARRSEVYDRVLQRFGAERVTCVSMMDTYRVRHAIRDVGAALGLPPREIDAIAQSFPHIRARGARAAIAELPELRASGLGHQRLDLLFEHVERLDALPRHVALHPCGIVLSDATLLDRTPVEASWRGLPMSQLDKDDVEAMGLLKLDILGIRMQSAMAHAVDEVARVDGVQVDLDDRQQVRLDDEATFRLIRSAHTLGCFQIESPGQRELVGKFAPETFADLVIDISLFRPGPVQSDMVTPFLQARQGWCEPQYLHPTLREVLAETHGVVVFHEQVLRILAITAGVSLAEADEARRALGSPAGQEQVEAWWRPAARARGYAEPDVDRIWWVLKAFASFGFCKAHAAAFALPTYQSAWLKAHHPAAFLAGVLTHDPGMYPKRLILDDARRLGIAVLGLDVNHSDATYRVERVDASDEPAPVLPDGRAYGIRLSLADVKGISATEVERVIAGRPYAGLADFWHRARVSRPVAERLVLAGGFDGLYGLGALAARLPVRRRGQVTRRDLILQVSELDHWTPSRTSRRSGTARSSTSGARQGGNDVQDLAAAQSQVPRAALPAAEQTVQLALDWGGTPDRTRPTGLPEMSVTERVQAELEVLGLDASAHVLDLYEPMLQALGITRSRDLLAQRNRSELIVAGVKVAIQTPPIRSGRRVIFLTLDDSSGPVDATFFEDVQGPYAATIFHSWLLLVRGVLRRTGPRGVSLRANGAWSVPPLWDAWKQGGLGAVHAALDETLNEAGTRQTGPSGAERSRRVLVHASGFQQSPYSDVKPAGDDVKSAPADLGIGTLWTDATPGRGRPPRRADGHRSPGSPG